MLNTRIHYLLLTFFCLFLLGTNATGKAIATYAQTSDEPKWKMPWTAGVAWRMTQGVHPKSDHEDFDTRGHSALDFKQNDHSGCGVDENQWIVAAAPGNVISSNGGVITIDHDEDSNVATGWQSQYVHVANATVQAGNEVGYGTPLGNPSCIGKANGSHLHFAILHENVYQSWVGRQISGWTVHYENGLTSLRKDARIVTACAEHTCSNEFLIVSDNEAQNLPPVELDVGSIVRVGENGGAYLDVYGVQDGSVVEYHVAPEDTGIVTDGPVALADGRILWQVHWYSGFYDLNDNPYLIPAFYPEEIVGWSDESLLEEATQTFSDVTLDNVYFPYTDMAFAHEIFTGYSNGSFNIDLAMPRGGFAKGVYNAAKFTPETSCGDFPDVPPTHEFYIEITTLKCLDIIHGYSDGTFRPEESLLRDQSTKFVTNTLVALGAIESVEACAASVTQFPDVPTDSLFYDDIRCVKGLDVFAGYSDGTFRPEDVVSRGQAAKILTGGRSILYYSRWNLNSLLECALVSLSAGIYTGNTMNVMCNLSETNNLYGAQIMCTAQPSILTPTDISFGNFFDPNASLTVPPEIDPANGALVGAISLQNPVLPISGDSADDFVTLQFQAVGTGTAVLTCNTLLSDRDGFVLPSTSSEIEITVLPSAAASDGTISYQGRLSHAGIEVAAFGPTSQTTTTDSEGTYAFAGLPNGFYEIQADAPRYLPSCTTMQLENDESFALPATTLSGGDVNNNDVINIGDATIIGAGFNGNAPSANARADINDDGMVNIQDLTILGGNYGKSGCQDW